MNNTDYAYTSIRLHEETANDIFLYVVRNRIGTIEFIGCGTIPEIVSMRAIKNNKFYNPSEVYEFCILHNQHFKRRIDALNALSVAIRAIHGGTPRMNLYSRGYNNEKRIVCLQTGEIFNNASEVCRKYEINHGQLSAHITGKQGYKTVKGMTFVYEYKIRKQQDLYNLLKYWTPQMFNIAPLEWESRNTGLTDDMVSYCFLEYMKQNICVHWLDKNRNRDGLQVITADTQPTPPPVTLPEIEKVLLDNYTDRT